MSIRRVFRALVVLAFSASFVAASCGQSLIAIMPGVVNDPGNLSLRRAILQFGIDKMCSEAKKRSMPLRLRQEDPSIGRFFVATCASQQLVDQNVFVQFGGSGYVWSNITQRMSFDAAGAITYDIDFLMDG